MLQHSHWHYCHNNNCGWHCVTLIFFLKYYLVFSKQERSFSKGFPALLFLEINDMMIQKGNGQNWAERFEHSLLSSQFKDDIEYLLDGISEASSLSTRCLSLIELASKCSKSAFRMNLRAHGTITVIFQRLDDAMTNQVQFGIFSRILWKKITNLELIKLNCNKLKIKIKALISVLFVSRY